MDRRFSYGPRFALRVLVLPVQPIKPDVFTQHFSLLRENSRIPLADVPPSNSQDDAGPISSLLAPTPASRGHLNLEFVEAGSADTTDGQDDDDEGDAWLHDFEIHRRTVAVVGILDCAEWAEDANGLDAGARAFEETVEKLSLSRKLWAKRCYAFGPRDSQRDTTTGLVVIPNVGDQSFYVHTLLAELCCGVLAGLSSAVSVHVRARVSLASRLLKLNIIADIQIDESARTDDCHRYCTSYIYAQDQAPPFFAWNGQSRVSIWTIVRGQHYRRHPSQQCQRLRHLSRT